jgi:anti-sigma factor RsiW
MMNCADIEELLPDYAEGGLSPEERAHVWAHIGECASCAEALNFYLQLEAELTDRRELRPSASVAATRVIDRLGMRQPRGVFAALLGMPGVLSGSFVAVGIALFLIRSRHWADVLSQSGWVAHMVAGIEWAANLLVTVAGGNERSLYGAYAGVCALLLLSGAGMVRRFIRQ